MKTGTLLIGVGNPFRNDDGAGIAVTRRLKEKKLSGVEILELSGEGTTLMESWRGRSSIIVFDATLSGKPPGTIYRIEAHQEKIPRSLLQCSTHSFGVAEAVEMSRSLGELPPSLLVYGIEGLNFESGENLSPSVEASVQLVADHILEELKETEALHA